MKRHLQEQDRKQKKREVPEREDTVRGVKTHNGAVTNGAKWNH